MIRWIKRIVAVFVGLGILGAVVMAMMPKPVMVETGKVSRGSLEVTVDEDGQTRVQQRFIITAPVAGHLQRIKLHAGDPIKVGDALVDITPTPSPLLDRRSRSQMEAQVRVTGSAVQRAKALLEGVRLARGQADRDLERTRTLSDNGALSTHTLEAAETQSRALANEEDAANLGVRVAQHELEMARAALKGVDGSKDGSDQLEITSPVEGSVLRVHMESAGVIGPGTPLLEIGDLSNLEIVVDLLTSDAVNVHPGDVVHLERWGGNESLEGRVRRVEPSAFTKVSALGVEEQRVLVIVDPVENKPWKGLGDGYRVDASITVWRGEDVLKVPANATFRHQNGWAVFEVAADKAVVRPIEVGRRTGLEVEVKGGINEDATVVLHPSDEIVDGTLVEMQ